MFSVGFVPEQWKNAIIVPVVKKRNKCNLLNIGRCCEVKYNINSADHAVILVL